MNRFFFLPLIIIGLSCSIIPVFATPVLTITPTSGPVSSTVTMSGTGYTNTTSSGSNHTMTGGSSNNFGGSIYLEKFTSLPVGGQTQFLTLRITNNGTGNFTQISSTNGAGHSTGFVNSVYVSKYVLSPGSNVTEINISTFAAAGNIRIKVYDGDGVGGAPSTQLYDGASVPAVLSGHYVFTSPVQVRSSGIIWAGFELTPATPADLYFCNGACNSALTDAQIHTFGSGPNPFVPGVTADHPFQSVNYTISKAYLRLKAYQDNGAGGGPHTLLGESGPQLIGNRTPGNPSQNFTITALTPASGNMWIGFESSITGTNFGPTFTYQSGNFVCCVTNFTSHTFGAGPNPITTTRTFDNPAMTLYFHPQVGIMSFFFDGFGITTTPSSVTTDATGKFSGVTFTVPSTTTGAHIVQATDSNSLTASKLFTVTTSTLPYVTDLHYIALSNNAVSLAWSTPPLNNHTSFHGYQIRYTTPYGTPNTILVNNTNSSSTAYNIAGLTANTQYSFQIGTWANSTDFFSLANILNFQTLSSSPPNLTVGNLNLNYTTNPTHVGYQFFRQNVNASAINLFVGYPNTYNTTCNLDYEFANTNHTYYNLSTTANGTGRVKAEFQFLNLGNEIVNTKCRDILTNDTGHYTITNSISSIPLVQQVQNFENGVYGTQGQFGAFDLIELMVIIISMIALNRVNETVGAIIMIFVIAGLAYFHIGSFPVIIFSAIAMIIVLTVSTTKRLAFSP